MKFNKQRKIYVGVLAVALVGLLIDRLVLSPGQSGPSAAQGAMVLELIPDASETIHAVLDESYQTKESYSLADHLQAICGDADAEMMGVKDAFVLPQEWVKRPEPQKKETPAKTPAERFREAHRLMAVMVDEHGGRAVINGTYLLVGQEKNGFRLLSVGKRSATVEFGDETIELKIDASQEKNDLQDGM